MKRLITAMCLVMAGWSGAGLAAHPVLAASLCVGSGSGCYATIQAALNAAHNGDVIHIGPGTFAGGITINVNVTIIGAGAGATIIKGGGNTPNAPVIRIGVYFAPSEPSVSISGVTITGGTNTSDTDPFYDSGGGIKVEPPMPKPGQIGPAGTITITNSVITGNSVRSLGSEPCGSDPTPTCSINNAGGIANFGNMTLTNTRVSNNFAAWKVSPPGDISGGAGGGIANAGVGTLTLRHSTVTGNTVSFETSAAVSDMFANGGGIESGGTLTMEDSTVTGNTVTITSTSTDQNSGVGGVGGGIHINGGQATIRDSQITSNSVTGTAAAGFVGASGGGIDDDGSLLLLDSSLSNNSVSATITSPLPTAATVAAGGGLEVDGSATIRDSRLANNRASATNPAGLFPFPSGSFILGGAVNVAGFDDPVATVTMTGSTVTGNSAVGTATTGDVGVAGGGIVNSGNLLLRDTSVSHNSTSATGAGGDTKGGGIWNDLPGGPPPHLTLIDSTITFNTLARSSAAIGMKGGGVYNGADDGATVTWTNSIIAQNIPDQCFGC